MAAPPPAGRRAAVVPSLPLECGEVLKDVQMSYMCWGKLNERGDNALVLFHAVNCSQDATEWWGPLVGPAKPIDTDTYFVFSGNALGGCFGTTGPDEIDVRTGKPFKSDFPAITIRDMVQLQAAALQGLGVTSVACVLGGGLGGMLALEYALGVRAPAPAARTLASLCSSGRHQPWQIGWGECQRQAIMADPLWKDGQYETEAPPTVGLATARMMAMITYRTHPAYWTKFGRSKRHGEQASFNVEEYLHHQGDKFISRGFSPRSYVVITRAMDSHDVSRGRGQYAEVLRSIKQPALLASISSDVLYPVNEQLELLEHMPNAQHHTIESEQGHDGFLLEHSKVATLIQGFLLDQQAAEAAAASGPPAPLASKL